MTEARGTSEAASCEQWREAPLVQESQSGRLVDTTSFVSTFPQVDGTEISRDNILQALETMIDAREIRSVHIEGQPGAGKSVLLAQFAKAYKARTISIFAKRSSWFTYDPSFLIHELAEQIFWLVTRTEPSFTEEISDEAFRGLLYRLRTYSSRIGKPVILLLDGLAEIPDEQEDLRRLLLSKLPLGLDYIKLLTSASAIDCNIKTSKKEWLIPPFSIEESLTFFNGILSSEQVRVVHATCGGTPGFLSGIRRLLESGMPADRLLSELPANMPEIFALEWRTVDETDSSLLEALALLAHDYNKHTLTDIAAISGASRYNLRASLSRLRFITVNPSELGEVEFVSDPFRQFVADKLSFLRETVTQKIIDKLSLDENSSESLTLLPAYLKQAGENKRLLRYLSPERFARLLDSQHQISPVRQKVLLGLETARELNNYSETMRFAVHSSALSEYSGFTVTHSEIAARLELQDEKSCIALAQAAVLTNDRLRLLALISRKKRERGQALEPELFGELEALFDAAEWKEFNSESLNELATDLVYVRPELATQALERATVEEPGSSTRLDFALARVSIAAETSLNDTARSSAQHLRSKIADPHFLSMFNAFASLLRDVAAHEVIAKVDELNAVKEQIYFLRKWSLHSRVEEGASTVTSYALDLAIRATEYTPTATDFRELAEALRRISDHKHLADLLRRFDAQRASVEALGPTIDFYYLQLLLALAEGKFDRFAAANRLVEIYSSVVQIKDLGVRTACLARVLDLLPLIDPDGSIRRREGLEELTTQAFDSSLNGLLGATADHTFATREIITALVPRHTATALRVALSLNIAPRRDEALGWLVSSILRVQDDPIDLSALRTIVDSFYDSDKAEQAICQVLERLSELDPSSINDAARDSAILFSARCSLKFRDGTLQVRACCAALLCINRFGVPADGGLLRRLPEAMIQTWERLDIDINKIDVGFSVAARLATLDRSTAETWLQKAESCRANHSVAAPSEPYRHCLLLMSRSYMGLLAKRLDQQDDIVALGRLIARIPSSLERLIVWADVALRILKCGSLNEARDKATGQIRGLLSHFQVGTCERFRAINIAIPALFLTSRAVASDLLDELPPSWLNSAVTQIANFITKKLPSWDPYETRHRQAYPLTIDEILLLCTLAEKANVDTTICWIMYTISSSLQTKEARSTISGNQKADVISKLKALRDSKFPTPNFIAHEGYRVVCSAAIAKLEKYHKETWENIITEGEAIPNVADKCLVLSEVAGYIGKLDAGWAVSILRNCERYVQEIPSALDRAQRLRMMAREAYDLDKILAKDLYRQALLMTSRGTTPEYEEVRRDIIDSAYQISPELASSIASALDQDVARRTKRGVSSRIEMLELRRQLMDERAEGEELSEKARHRLSEASWALLGSLNSGRIVPVKIAQTRSYLEHAAMLPFGAAFPIYSYVIGNAIERPQERAELERNLRGLHRSLATSADLFYFLAERSVRVIPARSDVNPKDEEQFCFVDPEQRSKGLAYIEKWLAEGADGDRIVIHDPYLVPSEVAAILKMILLFKPKVEVNFITSKIGLLGAHIPTPFADQFRATWAESSSQSAPITRVIVVAVGPEGNPIIHDRWWCAERSALDFGGSFNGLGGAKTTKIRMMTREEAVQAAGRLAPIAAMSVRHVLGKRVVYESVDI
jgi:AAA ATPase domain